MSDPATKATSTQVAFEAFGVRAVIVADDPAVIEALPALLPPGAERCDAAGAEERYTIMRQAADRYQISVGATELIADVDLDLALLMLDNQLKLFVALSAPNLIFVHAGVVEHAGRAILLPGLSFAGKTTIVGALLRAGATYYSDEYAVLDTEGRVHPYARPMSIRGKGVASATDDAYLGQAETRPPVPVGLIVVTSYRPGAQWQPRELSPGKAVLAMLSNTVAAKSRPDEALRTISKVVDGATTIEGDRGEADDIVHSLLEAAHA